MKAEYEKLLAGIERELTENTRDIERAERKLRELSVERRRLLTGKHGIINEIARLGEHKGAD